MNSEILSFFNENGYFPKDIILDGKVHKFSIDEKDKKKSAWYLGSTGHANKSGESYDTVTIGDFRNNEKFFYRTGGVTYTKEDKRNIKEQQAKAEKAAAQEKLNLQNETAQASQKLWEQLDLDGPSAYLTKKQIADCKTLGIKFNGLGDIYVPMRDSDGKLWSCQSIKWNGEKKFMYGGRVSACWHTFGELRKDKPIFIAEGFATAASIYIATGEATACSFNSGNLSATAKAIKAKYPEAPITICGDDDKWTTKISSGEKIPYNPGRECAEEVAKEIGAKVVFPIFKNKEIKQTDFNDLHCAEGINFVRDQINWIEPQTLPELYDRSYIENAPYPDDDEESSTKKGTLANFAELIRRLKINIRYNVISKKDEIIIPMLSSTIDNNSVASYARILDWCERIKLPHGNLKSYITALADENLFNPVAQWVTSDKWDGKSRLQELYDTIIAKNENKNINVKFMKERLILLWLNSAISCAMKPNGFSASGVLVLQGDQNLGKTSWFKRLAPAELNVIADGLSLDPRDKDSVSQALSKWIVELGELDSTFKADMSRLKAFLTKKQDTFRRPYAANDSEFGRRTIFFGSVNPVDFLKDPTGNRRFWTIECEKINYKHTINMQQLWAEIYEEYFLKGHTCNLSENELFSLNSHNEQFQEICPIEERIKEKFAWGQEDKFNVIIIRMTATKVCERIGIKDPKNNDAKRAGAALRKLIKGPTKDIKGCTNFPVPVIMSEEKNEF